MTWRLMPLFLAGVLCNTAKVEYHQLDICAVKGSAVVIPCSFANPGTQRLNRVLWGRVKSDHSKVRVINNSASRKVTSRFQYIGDKQHNCSLRIIKVELNDAGRYIVRLNSQTFRWPGYVGSTLKVVDLNVSVTKPNEDGTIKEGDSVTLTCVNGCDGDRLSSALSWFKDGEPINEGPVLYLSNMSSTNSGNYTCSLKTSTGTTSEAINIDVEYGPKNTSVSVEPSMEIDAGSISTLICCSHANPPVENYIWFKIDENGNIMDVGHQPVIFSGDGGQYFCRATNKHGSQNSTVVTLKIKTHWAVYTLTVLVLTVPVLLTVTTIAAIRRVNRKRKWATNKDCGDENMQNTENDSWLTQPEEGNQCEGEAAEVLYATIDFINQRKSNTEQQMDSYEDEENVIYSTVCR